MLDAIDESQLRSIIAGLARAPHPSAPTIGDPAAQQAPAEPVFFGGIRPDLPDEKDEPSPVVRGHSVGGQGSRGAGGRGRASALPIVAATGAVVLVGGAVAASCCTAGMRTDVPASPPPPPSATSPPAAERVPSQAGGHDRSAERAAASADVPERR
jgi:hypothetical protein